MAEGFAIFGAISGTIGTFTALLEGVEKIYGNVHTLKGIQQELKVKRGNLKCQFDLLLEWRDNWMIWHEDENSRLHRYLWGDRFDRIYESLSAIDEYLKPLSAKLKATPRSRLPRWGYAIRYTLITQKAIAADLGDLETLIKILKTEADAAFRREHRDQSSGLIGEAFQLVSLAKATHVSSEKLYTTCRDSGQEIVLDLDLNFFHKESEYEGLGLNWREERKTSIARLWAISASAKAGKLHFTFLASEKRPTDHFIRIHVMNDSSLNEHEYQRTLPRALEKVYRREKPKIGFDTTGNDRDHRFVIGEPSATRKWDSESLRRSLSRSHQDDGNAARELKYLTKLKVALELVDCGMLFLQTSWLSELCSCALRRVEADPRERIHTLRITQFEHVTPSYENNNAPRCWCEQDPMQGKHVQRLGVLLVELALERLVFDVAKAADSTDLQLSFPPITPTLNLSERLRRAGVDEAYVRVVIYCLKCTWTRDQVLNNESLLLEYYWKILQPYVL